MPDHQNRHPRQYSHNTLTNRPPLLVLLGLLDKSILGGVEPGFYDALCFLGPLDTILLHQVFFLIVLSKQPGVRDWKNFDLGHR